MDLEKEAMDELTVSLGNDKEFAEKVYKVLDKEIKDSRNMGLIEFYEKSSESTREGFIEKIINDKKEELGINNEKVPSIASAVNSALSKLMDKIKGYKKDNLNGPKTREIGGETSKNPELREITRGGGWLR